MDGSKMETGEMSVADPRHPQHAEYLVKLDEVAESMYNLSEKLPTHTVDGDGKKTTSSLLLLSCEAARKEHLKNMIRKYYLNPKWITVLDNADWLHDLQEVMFMTADEVKMKLAGIPV